jgi:DNA-binding NarL/FixJ family response regulator
VEDHRLFAEYLETLLRSRLGLEVCGCVGDARGGLGLVRNERPDLVIVDLTLSAGHGLELLKDLGTLMPAPVALVVSGHEDGDYAERCLEAGAHGYVRKTCGSVVLLEAVRSVLAGQVHVSPEVMQAMLTRRRARGAAKSALDALTDREIEVLEGMGRGHGSKEIAASLGIDPGTIDNHRARLREKLGMPSMHALAVLAFQWVHLGVRPGAMGKGVLSCGPEVVARPTADGVGALKVPPCAS